MSIEERTLADHLETLVDSNSVHAVLEALASVCYGKSAHILMNWQDKNLARTWEKAAIAVDRLSIKLEV
jgi:hypothetical protein